MNDLHSIQSMNTSQSSMCTDRVSIATFHCVIKQFQDTAINQAMWDLGQILGLPWPLVTMQCTCVRGGGLTLVNTACPT